MTFLSLPLWLLLTACACAADVVFVPQDEKGVLVPSGRGGKNEGRIRVAYDKALPCIDTIVMIGVGTAMSVGDYSSLSELAVQNSSLALVMADNRPGNPIKHAWGDWDHDPRDKLVRLAYYVKTNISKYVHRLCHNDGDTKFVLGGHSSSGITAGEVIVDNGVVSSFTIDAYLGIDPDYQRIPSFLPGSGPPWSGLNLSSLPSMVWGNSKDTCLVVVDSGGKLGYQKSSDKFRVLYQIQLGDNTSNGHCDVTDRGCLIPILNIPICALSDQSESVKSAVAASIHKLAKAIQQKDPGSYFNRQFLTIPVRSPLKLKMSVNSEDATATQ